MNEDETVYGLNAKRTFLTRVTIRRFGVTRVVHEAGSISSLRSASSKRRFLLSFQSSTLISAFLASNVVSILFLGCTSIPSRSMYSLHYSQLEKGLAESPKHTSRICPRPPTCTSQPPRIWQTWSPKRMLKVQAHSDLFSFTKIAKIVDLSDHVNLHSIPTKWSFGHGRTGDGKVVLF